MAMIRVQRSRTQFPHASLFTIEFLLHNQIKIYLPDFNGVEQTGVEASRIIGERQ